nr:5789_t:CDS:2 [Entrophospora candida]
MDHAGISAQSKIEKLNLTKLDTREKKREYTFQWEKLGLLIDYERASFTLDPAVQKQLESVISDIEVEHKVAKSKLYYLKYPFQNSNGYLEVATSRPETIFADVALFVNPNDSRYQNVKMDFGSGVLKCTPGHDFTDYELGKRHQLSIISCCDEKGILNELAGQWQGQEISSIRKVFVLELEKKGICVKVEEYETNLAYSMKSGALIESLLSRQWFLDLPNLIRKVEEKQTNFLSQIEFVPNKFQKVLES